MKAFNSYFLSLTLAMLLNDSAAFAMGGGMDHNRLEGEIAQGRYSARTCVASMIADPKTNELLIKEVHSNLKRMGYPKELHKHLVDFKTTGPKGLRECLEGSYEDVTIFAHTAEGLETNFIYQVAQDDGSFQNLFLPSRFWEHLESGRFPISPTVQQITLANCSAETLLNDLPILKKIASRRGIALRILPYEWALHTFLDGAKLVTHIMSGLAIAENAQPEFAEDIYCLVHSGQSGFIEEGRGTCLRGRMRAQIQGVGLGVKYANRMFKVSKRPQGSEIYYDWSLLALVNLEASVRMGGRINPASNFTRESSSHESYAFSLGLYEKALTVDQSHCFEHSDPVSRMVCRGDVQALQEALEQGWIDKKDLIQLNDWDRAPIHIAAINNDKEMLLYLFENGVSLESQNSAGWNALTFAAYHRSRDVLWKIRDLAQVLHQDHRQQLLDATEQSTGKNVLQLLSDKMLDHSYGNIFQTLIFMGVQVNHPDHNRQTFLDQVAENNNWSSSRGCIHQIRIALRSKHHRLAAAWGVKLPGAFE